MGNAIYVSSSIRGVLFHTASRRVRSYILQPMIRCGLRSVRSCTVDTGDLRCIAVSRCFTGSIPA